jgi:RimJ/RimL family protein N-acetyltransferase
MTLDAMWEHLPKRLEGRIVTLEALSREHEVGLRAAGADAAIWRWMRVGDVDAWLRWIREESADHPFAILRDGLPVGSSSYMAIAPEHRRLEIGNTWMQPSTWGTGANVEAKYLLLRYAFEELGCVRVEFKTDAKNERARAALAAIPAQFEGIHRNHMLVRGGTRRDSAWYSVIDDEWPSVKAALERRIAAKV